MEIFEITDLLFQSPLIGSDADYQEILAKGISVVIDMNGAIDPVDAKLESYLFWAIEDGDAPDMDKLNAVAEYGAAMVKKGLKVLSHCAAGVNRSGLVNARILMLTEGLTGQQAIDKVRAGRPGALQNQNFVNLLLSLTKGGETHE